ncbi:bacteriocin class II family protein [Clostridium botulinum]|uniref:bacteriocin class II family protein n=1 Tax=Clostridium botulinum TaxID=1491 RepID=UPI0009478159|nr:bacteriocin class II family protein [Clostridium botulinum]APQ98748.1 bacteriocin class II with double-glycine leader peptide family protein [Clostridium botulinum]MBN3364183.1 bacteriocin [Clostridium botulinum]
MENLKKMDLNELEKVNGGIKAKDCAKLCYGSGAAAYGAGYVIGNLLYNVWH